MTENIYIKFADTQVTSEEKKKNRRRFDLIGTLLFFIPKANPDFENVIQDIAEWQLEIDLNDNLPVREIGVNSDGFIVFICPWGKNNGFWLDEPNDIDTDFFKNRFNAVNIDKSEFDKNWDIFLKANPEPKYNDRFGTFEKSIVVFLILVVVLSIFKACTLN